MINHGSTEKFVEYFSKDVAILFLQLNTYISHEHKGC